MKVRQINGDRIQVVRSLGGERGSIGGAGIIAIAPFVLPADASEVAVTPMDADVISAGNIVYGTLPGLAVGAQYYVRLRKDNLGYYLRSLFKIPTSVNFSAESKIFVNADQTVAVLTQDVTIAISGGTAIQIEPNIVPSIGTIRGILSGIAGVYTRDSTTTFFTPANTLSAPILLLANIGFVKLGENASTNPLQIGNIALLSSGDRTLTVQGNIALYDNLSRLFSVEPDSGWSFVIANDPSNTIAFGIKDDGSVSIRKISQDFYFGESEFLQNADPDYAFPIGDANGAMAFGIRKVDGAVELQKLAVSNSELANYLYDSGFEFPVFDVNGTIATAYRKDTGSFLISRAEIATYSNEIRHAPQVVPGASGTILYTQVTPDGLQQIFSFNPATAVKTQLTYMGNNVQPYYDAGSGKIFFSSDRRGQPAPHQMDVTGLNQQDIIWSSEATLVDRWVIAYNGQSNSVFSEAYPGVDTCTAYLDTSVPAGTGNLKLIDSGGTYNINDPNAATLSLTSAVEPHKPLNGGVAYPQNISGSGTAVIAHQLSAMLGNSHVSILTSTGQGGTGFEVWGPDGTGNAYAANLYEARAIKRLCTAASKTVQQALEILICGEDDVTKSVQKFKEQLISYYERVQTDKKPIFGQTRPIPVLLTQQSCFGIDAGAPNSTQAQFEAARDHPLIYLADTGYQYRYAPTGSPGFGTSVHLNMWSHRRRQIKLGQVACAVYRWNQPWLGLTPIKIALDSANNRVIVSYFVPFGPLRFDPWMPAPTHAWPNGRGFELVDINGNPVVINSATISGNDVILSFPVGAAPYTIRYAMTAASQSGGYVWGDRNNPNSRKGAVCDSDPLRGYDLEVLTCNVTNNSTNVTIGSAGFLRRGWYDRVTGASLAAGAIVSSRVSDTQLTLSNPWTGATGTANLTFWYDQSNYGQAFTLPVNYAAPLLS